MVRIGRTLGRVQLTLLAVFAVLGWVSSTHVSAATITGQQLSLQVNSPDFSAGGSLPTAATCDGAGRPPVIRWSTPPAGTKSMLIVMETEPGPPRPGDPQDTVGDYSWTLYNIPAKVRSTARNPGTTGHNSHNPDLAYAPPCSQGPGAHTYTITVYALSQRLKVPADGATGDLLQAQAAPLTRASGSITAVVTRSTP